MENNKNMSASANTATGKKGYQPKGVALVEVICSTILVIALFLPWVRVEAVGESKEFTLTEHGPIAFIYGGVFALNIILKFFKRSRWLSALVAIIAVLMHTELGAEAINAKPSYSPVQFVPAIGEQIVFMVGLVMMAVLFLSWIASIWKSIVQAYRTKQYFNLYSSSLGLFFLCFLAMLLAGVAFTGNADKFFEGEDNPFKMAVGAFFMIGMFIFFCWGVVGGIVWLIRKIRRGTDEPTKDAGSVGESMHEFSGNKPINRMNLIVGIVIVLLFLLICVRYLRTCSASHKEPNTPSVEASDKLDTDSSVERAEMADTSETTAEQYVLFEDNGKTGVKDGSGKVIIPAEYTTESFDIDDNQITAIEAESGHIMCYFKKTGQLLSHINASYGSASGVTLYHFADTDTHAFYTEEGEVKARGLSGDIFCLRQINPQTGYAIRTYYGFRNKENNDDFMPVYNDEGNRVCTFNVNGWQLFGIDHLERNEDEPRDFEKEFTFTIALDDFIAKNRSAVR